MQAIILAAGMGRRMGKLTESHTKCMMPCAGKTLLEWAVESLVAAGIHKLILVVGYQAETLKDFIAQKNFPIDINYVYNYDYADTNNIYSLYLAREHLANDDTILLESDLIFDPSLVKTLVENKVPNLVTVAKYESWMDGTVVTLDEKKHILDFIEKANFAYRDADKYYKTVNIYKFSKNFSINQYIPFLEAYIRAYGKNQYYELVLKIFAHIKKTQLTAFILGNEKWYEIDDVHDLDIADTIFSNYTTALEKYEKHFGGYWKFPKLNDFCYLVNPYYPPSKMLDQLLFSAKTLITHYPSGMNVQRMMAAAMFDISEKYIFVGNGSAELINCLGSILTGELAVCIPTFNEYLRCFRNCSITMIPFTKEFMFDFESLCAMAKSTKNIILINPDNPTGSFICYDDMLTFLDICHAHNTNVIIDESFIDFADKDIRYTLIKDNVVQKYPNLIIIKSIGKSYGIAGLRLGVLVTANSTILKALTSYLSIWNINSFAECFLQIQNSYKRAYEISCNKIAENRKKLISDIIDIGCIQAYPSQANYIMCRLDKKYSSRNFVTQLLKDYGILIKDYSMKKGFNGRSFFRIAIKTEAENNTLIEAMKDTLVRQDK